MTLLPGVDEIPLLGRAAGRLLVSGFTPLGPDPSGALDALAADDLVSLITDHDIALRFPDYADRLAADDRAARFPIPDYGVVDDDRMLHTVLHVAARLRAGRSVLVHCGAGMGRAGTTAILALAALGLDAAEAATHARRHRVGAGPESPDQHEQVARLVGRMAAARRRVVLLDVDGTLVTGGDPHHVTAFDRALSDAAGAAVTIQGLDFAGRSDRAIGLEALARAGIDAAFVDPALDRYGHHYERLVAGEDRAAWALAGAGAAVDLLAAAGPVGLVTGNGAAIAAAKLRAASIRVPEGPSAFGPESEDRARLVALALERAGTTDGVVVGDTPRDVEAARAVGIRCVAVATGRFAPDALAAAGADVVLDDLADAPRLLGAVHP